MTLIAKDEGYALHPETYTDLQEIAEYIPADSPDAARRVINKIFDAIEALVPFPHRGHKRPDLTSCPLRFWRVYDYLIAYAPNERRLWVIAVMHGHRSWPQSPRTTVREIVFIRTLLKSTPTRGSTFSRPLSSRFRFPEISRSRGGDYDGKVHKNARHIDAGLFA
ncbi:MAG: type II toxin-antitoxin system RelE/ParE family toxin [Acidobacteriaceae bacterium]|nr:type II toxin-antitoxin system RelE/ParE family toxin [Acidobacteriaceae bacterium]MBV9295609.1 type II toxin-antitoxin system RelE/ParE family toxin [Acidobacteriaceae bacterium]MBV9764720.1 type II toxin-antitoxin system RelE/ParE family toxin [Acidobacteriaceae bacterium]